MKTTSFIISQLLISKLVCLLSYARRPLFSFIYFIYLLEINNDTLKSYYTLLQQTLLFGGRNKNGCSTSPDELSHKKFYQVQSHIIKSSICTFLQCFIELNKQTSSYKTLEILETVSRSSTLRWSIQVAATSKKAGSQFHIILSDLSIDVVVYV